MERQELFARLGSETQRALIITEGVIGYLNNGEAETLARDLNAISSFRYWIMDFSQGYFRAGGHSSKLNNILKNTPLKFSTADPLAFFERFGWITKEIIYILDEADRQGRRMPFMFPWSLLMKLFPGPLRRLANKTYGYVMFEKSGDDAE